MATLTLSSFDFNRSLIAAGRVEIDRPLNEIQSLVWHIDPQEPKDLFDFTTGVTGSINWVSGVPVPNGQGTINAGNRIELYFGTGLAQFAVLDNVMIVDPEDEDGGNLVSITAGTGWLVRGKRVPSGPIVWTVT